MTASLKEDQQSFSAHCTMFVRRWHRAVLAVIEWLVTGTEKPIGPLGHRFVRAEFQPNRGGIQHYHILLETLLQLTSADPSLRSTGLQQLRSFVTRNLLGTLLQIGLPRALAEELQEFASVILKHHHTDDCFAKVDPLSGVAFCKRGCPWTACTDAEGAAVHIRLCADEAIKQVMLDLDIAYENPDGSISLYDRPDACIHLYQTGGLGTDELSSVNVVIFLIVLANTNLQLVDHQFVIDYLEWYAAADNERSVVHIKQNPDGTWSLHAASEDWHKVGHKHDAMVGYIMSVAEMTFLLLGNNYVVSDVERIRCPAVPLSQRFMTAGNKLCIASYGVMDMQHNVTKPVNLANIGHTFHMNPFQTGKGRSKAMIWMSANDLADMRDTRSPRFTDEQIDLFLNFKQARLSPDKVSLWAGRDPQLQAMLLECYWSETVHFSHSEYFPNMGITAAERGFFQDVFGNCRRLCATLFMDPKLTGLALSIIQAVCFMTSGQSDRMYRAITRKLPSSYVKDAEFDFDTLPYPFNSLISTLQACVSLVQPVLPCDGPIFLYQWALRHSYGPTELDIFRLLYQGKTMLDVLHDNHLLAKNQDSTWNWKRLFKQVYYSDLQFHPMHRKDREGIMQRSIDMFRSWCEPDENALVPIRPADLESFKQRFGCVHIVTPHYSLLCLQTRHKYLHPVIIACTELSPSEARTVIGSFAFGSRDTLKTLHTLKPPDEILCNAMCQHADVECPTSLALVNNLHQAEFDKFATQRVKALRSAVATMPAWEQSNAPAWTTDPSCRCNHTSSAHFPSDLAWADMQQCIALLTNAISCLRTSDVLSR